MQSHLLKVDIIAVGGLSQDVSVVAADYTKRLKKHVQLEVHEIKAEPVQRGETAIRAEGERIAARITKLNKSSANPATIVALDSDGAQKSSKELAQAWLSHHRLIFIIGGSQGIDQELKERAHQLFSFGKITLPHQLARVVLLEQLYRSFKILKNEPYHF